MMDCGCFDTTRNDNHSSFLTPTVVGGRCPLSSEICAQSHTPFEKRRLRPISAHNVSTVGDSEKKSNHDDYKVDNGLSNELYTVSKNGQNCFCQNFVKFPPILIIFGIKMIKRLKICKVHSFSTSSNLRHHTTVFNANVPNCYTTL